MRLRRRLQAGPSVNTAGLSPQAGGQCEASKTTIVTDALRTSLELMKDSADACPPLKSATSLVIALCNLADRVVVSDESAQALAWRAATILDAMYQSLNPDTTDTTMLSPVVLHQILHFEQILTELHAAMESLAKKGRVHRILHLHRNESQLVRFGAELESAAEGFTIGMMTYQAASLAALARVDDTTQKVHAELTAVTSWLEQSNIELGMLRNQVKFLQFTVVFLA